MKKLGALVVFAVLLASCGPSQTNDAGIVVGATGRVPAPVVAAPQAMPAIYYAQLSSTAVQAGSWWSGRVVTGTNVASVVLSLPFFSFAIPRKNFGDFAFRTHVEAVPGMYRQTLHGSIVAYNAAGVSVSLPIAVTFK